MESHQRSGGRGTRTGTTDSGLRRQEAVLDGGRKGGMYGKIRGKCF